MSDENNTEGTNTAANTGTETGAAGSVFQDAKTHAKQAADDLRAAAESKARELKEAAEIKARELRDAASAKAGEFKERAGHYYEEARGRARTWQGDGEAYVRENPMRAVCTALFAGFVVGLLIRKN
jgi:ElaB/YqjD/DUF883 family membrane-anchored ribosome-binding protein